MPSSPPLFCRSTKSCIASSSRRRPGAARRRKASLAGIGLERTHVELVADPAAGGNGHQLSASGAFGKLDIAIENRPLAANPKSSEMTALGLVRLIENRVRPLVC
jgi:predicted dinucleotide-utilizing enzyme